MKSLCYPRQAEDKYVALSASPINFTRTVAMLVTENTGAQVIFSGIVRGKNGHKEVLHLDYEAHPVLAVKSMNEIVGQALRDFDILQALCIHRTGIVRPGELAVLIVVNGRHRAASYEASRFLIERIKHDVPIWKKEIFTDLTYEWGRGC